MHDSQKFIDVLSENTSQDTYVDSAYGGEEYELTLKALGYRPHIFKKALNNTRKGLRGTIKTLKER